MTEDKAEVMPNIDYIYSAVIADSEALEEAKMTLEVIKKTDPGVYDEMINDTLSLIRKALSSSILSVVDRMVKVEVEMEREACASIEVHLTTPDRDYTTMSPLDAYEAALIDAAIAFREAIRARGQS
jgi:hypothetical protein